MLKIIKHLIPWIMMVLSTVYLKTDLYALDTIMVTKYDLPYEVMSITSTQDNLQIQGWAFISYKQHFDSAQDHLIQLEFISVHHQFTIDANLTSISQTAMMTYFGSPTCSETSTYQIAETCNYRYENVGFNVNVPLDHFIGGETYQTNIIVNGFRVNLSYKTPLYYPLNSDLKLISSSKEITIISRLDDTNLLVNATTVLARKEPSKTGLTWFYGANCSTSYLNQLYFMKNTTYTNVFEKRVVDDTSFYRVSANLYICSVYRRRIIEGTTLSPVWIASPYVSYTGSPLQVSIKNLNQAPYFVISNLEITEGETLDYHLNVHAYDPEEGDISDRIMLTNSNFINKVGVYELNFSVKDQYGLEATGILLVNVLTKPNFIPIIYADNQTVLQYSSYDPLMYVSSMDIEDGDLSSEIRYESNVDTRVLGYYNVCYSVTDYNDAQSNKCIVVQVVSLEEYLSRYRFISYNEPFFNEAIPSIWDHYLNTLINLLKPSLPIYTVELD